MKKIITITTILVGLVFIFAFYISFKQDNKDNLAQIIVSDLKHLKTAFEKIHTDCTILSFDHIKNPITFLNVIKFTGSEIGSMNLVYPEHWKGPYLKENPTIKGTEYQILYTNEGYFILPGDTTVLPNDFIVGKDIVITEETSIKKLLNEKKLLCYKDHCFAIQVDLDSPILEHIEEFLED